MTTTVDMAAAAALIGDPARANILTALMDGRAHTATELALVSGVTPPTASGHLAKLTRARMLAVVAQGRHRYYRLASTDVARMLESIMGFAAAHAPHTRRATPRIDPKLRRARTCYDHIAGELGVAIADRLAARGIVAMTEDSCIVTDAGRRILRKAGILTDAAGGSRRPDCRPCLDWSERRPHLAGALGTAIQDHALQSGWLRKSEAGRALKFDGDICDVLLKLGFP